MFCLKISTACLILLAISSFELIGQTDAQVFQLINQYYQCGNLKMIKTLVPGTNTSYYYAPNANISNNYLSDSYFKSLATMTIDQGLSLVKKIFVNTTNCNTYFCNCVSWMFIDNQNNYSVLFRNDTNYVSARTIINALYTQTASKLNKGFVSFFPPNAKKLPTLAKFVAKIDYSINRELYYDTKCSNTLDSVIKTFYITFYGVWLVSILTYGMKMT